MLEQLSLDGDWLIHGSDGTRGNPKYAEDETIVPHLFFPARVPGCVHLDLMKAGVIADPADHLNALAARWVEDNRWHYRKEFEAPEAALKGRAWLYFACLDINAKVLLNGKEIATHCNAFLPLRIDVTKQLKKGRNLLVVHLDSGLWAVGDKPATGWQMNADQILTKRHWLRKPQFEFNWDWATRLINVGISGKVHLEWSQAPVRLDKLVLQAYVEPDLNSGRLRARALLEGPASGETEVTLSLKLKNSTLPPQKITLSVKPGLTESELELIVPKPDLWWPAGLGAQTLYEAELTLEQSGHKAESATAKTGFRHVKVVQDKHPEAGSYFYFEVNGRKVFCRGANLVPADLLLSRVDKARYEGLIQNALELNFNFLRVWGGGIYESDDFYQLCDEKGILVWQDFIYACGKYPMIDQVFHESALAEASYQIDRLSPHPSLVAWCGNNENEVGNWEWSFNKGTVYPDYAFFHLDLPRLLAKRDPWRYYQASSPITPGAQPPNSDIAGDQHPWQVGFWNSDFRDYRKMISRFPNEGGFLGPVSLPTMLRCLPENQRYPGSFAWQQHDNSINSWYPACLADKGTELWLGKEVNSMSVEDYCYWGGLVQGEALREYIENFRRRMFNSASAIFWMFNDSWPVVRSWTVIDYDLRRTPAFYPVKRAMAPLGVVLAEEEDEVVVFGVNDTDRAATGKLRFGLMALEGKLIVDESKSVALEPNSSTRLASFKRGLWKTPMTELAFAQFEGVQGEFARNRLILPLFKEMAWPKPDLKVQVVGGKAIFESKSFVWGVCLDLSGEEKLADNFFDVWPGIPYEMPWKGTQPPKILRVGNKI
jgi:beta-mannosidase